MAERELLSDLLAIFAVSITVVFVFHKVRLPSIAGFLAAGTLIGPYGLNLISDLDRVRALADIGVVLLLFTIGIDFSLRHLASARALMLIGGPLQVGGVILLAVLVGLGIDLPMGQAVFWGCLISLSSTAIVLKALSDRGEADSLHGRATVGILIFQDLAVVPMLLLTPVMAHGGGSDLGAALWQLGKSMVIVGSIVGAALIIVPRILEQIVRSRSRELFLLTIILLCLGIGWLTSLSGLSLAIGAFLAGLVVSESEYSHQALAEVLPLRDSFNSLFFVSVGMLMDPQVVLANPALIGAIVAAILVGKFVTGAAPVLIAGLSPRAAIVVGMSIAQVGEFSFILGREGYAAGLLTGHSYQVFLAVSVVTMVLTPFLMQSAPAMARRVEAVQRLRHWLPERTTAHLEHRDAPGLRIKDHVIIVGYGLNGRNLARVLAETEIPYVVLDLDGPTIQRESKRGLPIFYGDATSHSVLRRMRVEEAKVLVLAISDPFTSRRAVQIARELNPQLHIVVRTRYLRELEELHALGANEVVPEEFETSIEIFALVLRTYKLPTDFIMRKAEQIRQEKYALLRRGAMPELAHHLREGMLADADVETCRIDEDSPVVGKALGQVNVRPRTGASVIAFTRAGVTESNPNEKVKLQGGDVLVLLGTREQIQRAISLLVGE